MHRSLVLMLAILASYAAGYGTHLLVPVLFPSLSPAAAIREARDQAMFSTIDPSTTDPTMQWRRRRTLAEHARRYVHTEDVTEVIVSKTVDTGVWVISIVSPDRQQTSFWTMGSEEGIAVPVRIITAY